MSIEKGWVILLEIFISGYVGMVFPRIIFDYYVGIVIVEDIEMAEFVHMKLNEIN